ncbi:hypothetical protein [Vibrio rotiferianus]|uniref:hypothetical protein n=1 Tax=Vibrio rotiferianus TaxID=190895 RepID=UPI00390A507D
MLSEEQVTLLKKAYYEQLPEEIAEVEETAVIRVLKSLIDYGLMDADDVTNSSGPLFLNVRITLLGRQYISELSNAQSGSKSDIIELKPNVSGIGINLKALYRKIQGK